jgi:hypothetical protein
MVGVVAQGRLRTVQLLGVGLDIMDKASPWRCMVLKKTLCALSDLSSKTRTGFFLFNELLGLVKLLSNSSGD